MMVEGKLIIYKAPEPNSEFEIRFVPSTWPEQKTTPIQRVANREDLTCFLNELGIDRNAQKPALGILREPHNLDTVIRNLRLRYDKLRAKRLLP